MLFVRIMAGLNAIYQGGVGLLSLLLPTATAPLYRLVGVADATWGIVRIVGGLMVANALLLGLYASNPQRHRTLLPILLVGTIANLLAPILAVASGELTIAQLGGSIAAQTLLLFALGWDAVRHSQKDSRVIYPNAD